MTGAAARRNENVQVNRIDNDALKEANIRLGDNVTLISVAPAEAGYYAAEHGRPAVEPPVLRAIPPLSGWHGELFESLQNSIFNARTFFQVGDVLPSRQNQYGGRFGGPVPGLGSLTGTFSQRKTRGMVNGNVLVPLASERTALATDPAVRATIERFLAAYPAQLPNRPDFDLRALNTNAPQRIDEINGTLRLDRDLSSRDRLSLFQFLNRQRIDAFQLVAGQNPDTEIHTLRSQLTYRRQLAAGAEMVLGGAFNRIRSGLAAEPNAVGPRVRFGYQIEELGPDSLFPINRAVNTFRGGAVFTRTAPDSNHTLTFGGDLLRTQLNGIETNNQRGLIWFSNNFGRTAIENLRMGTPTTYEVTIGAMERGFRNLGANLFFGDQWKATPRLQIYYGIRYSLDTAPVEVNARNTIPYGCDCNNFSPRFSIAYRLGGEWVLRTAYTTSFGQVQPVTYGQSRYNPPGARYLVVQNPDLLHPLKDIDLNDPSGRYSPTVLTRELATPYSHQYNLSFENRLAGRYLLRFGYVGSRTFKMLDSYQLNRAIPAAGIPLTTQTVNQRRPDPRYYDVKYIVNAGAGYMDAAQVALESSRRTGLNWALSYTFGKALDTGADYAATGANNDISKGRSQSGDLTQQDRKGLSIFDSTHALLISYSYELPRPAGPGALGWLLNGWQISGTTLLKSGTPLTLYVGSDAPGFGNVDGGSGDRPNIVDPSILGKTVDDPNTAPLIVSRDRFAYIRPGEARGSLGRNTFRKDGIANFNTALTKQWRWDGWREWTLLLRGEAYNLMNHPQFDEPQRNLSSPAFGKITNTLNDGRVLQIGLRLVL
ncbi:MAG: hypothetical protein IT158_00740 [Bryobacterales bacterium]|nr:hypothetical protein [Bryobacterales bacterium]